MSVILWASIDDPAVDTVPDQDGNIDQCHYLLGKMHVEVEIDDQLQSIDHQLHVDDEIDHQVQDDDEIDQQVQDDDEFDYQLHIAGEIDRQLHVGDEIDHQLHLAQDLRIFSVIVVLYQAALDLAILVGIGDLLCDSGESTGARIDDL